MKKFGDIQKYVLYTYLAFWIMILVIGGSISVLTNSNRYAMQWVVVICSWSPTFVLFAMSKKILKDKSLKEFYKEAFRDRIRPSVLIFSTLIMVSIYFISILLFGFITSSSISANISITFPTIFWSFLFSVLQGASGEESGWRGYLFPRLIHKYGFNEGNIILGFIWAFWHLPLWFISGEYSGLKLIQYIVVFILFVVSFTILIGWVQQKCRNLFLAFWMHFLFNFTLTTINTDSLLPITIMAFLYFAVAVVIIITRAKVHKTNNTHIF